MHRRASIRVTFGIALALVVTAGCGDPGSNGELTDEAADQATQGEGSGESSNAMEAGSEGGSSSGGESGSGEGVEGGTAEASEASDMADTSASGSGSSASGSETIGSETIGSESETETGGPPDCTMLDERECSVVDTCASYYGQPFTQSIDGMLCLAPAEFLGCLFAEQACLPATGTLCSVQGAFHVDNLCPPPDGFVACDPPIDPPPPSCP